MKLNYHIFAWNLHITIDKDSLRKSLELPLETIMELIDRHEDQQSVDIISGLPSNEIEMILRNAFESTLWCYKAIADAFVTSSIIDCDAISRTWAERVYLVSVCECHQVRWFKFIVDVRIHHITTVQHLQLLGCETKQLLRHFHKLWVPLCQNQHVHEVSTRHAMCLYPGRFISHEYSIFWNR